MLLGSANILDAKLGTAAVSKVYRGSQQLFPSFTPWTMVLLPDTQNITQYSADLTELFQYVADQKVSRNIKMLMHVGDFVAGQPASSDPQWVEANNALQILKDASIAHIIGIGNHCYDNSSYLTNRLATNWHNELIDISYYRGQSWYIDEQYETDQANNTAAKITVGGITYLFVTCEYRPRAGAVDWCVDLMNDYSDEVDYIILQTHNFTQGDGSRTNNSETDYLWDEIKDISKLRLVVSGHTYGVGTGQEGDPLKARRTDGNIHQHGLNYQKETANGYEASGAVRFYTFNADGSVDAETWNAFTDIEYTDGDNKFTFSI